MSILGKLFPAAALCLIHGLAIAQPVATPSIQDEPERQARLVEGARKEGSLVLYATTPVDYMRVIIAGFEKKYGVKVTLWRSNSEALMQRALNEARASTPSFDVVECISPPMEAMQREGLLKEVRSPVQAELHPWALPAHRQWAATQLYLFVQAYNTNLVKKEDLPRSYADLLDPKWKGKLSIEASDHQWFSEVVAQMGRQKGIEFWTELVSRNGISVRTGHSLLSKLVSAGEVPLALTVYNSDPPTLMKQGAPIDWFAIQPAIAISNGVAVSRKAPHPQAALLFYEYLLSEEAQKVLSEIGYVTSHKGLPQTFKQKLKVLDAAQLLDESQASFDLFQQVVVKPIRN